MKRFLLALLLVLACIAPSRAQFADQATYAGTSSGTGTAFTVTIPNVSSLADIQGVLIKWVPNQDNGAGGTTLAVTGTTATAIRKPTFSGLIALVATDLRSGVAVTVMYDGTQFVLMSPPLTAGTATSLGASTFSYSAPTNFGLTASASAGALTVTVTTAAGGAPSASSPTLFLFGSGGSTSIAPSLVSLTATLPFVISSGNTLGCVTTAACRLWLLAANDGGTVRLCAVNVVSGTSIIRLTEVSLVTTAGSNGGSSAQTVYCSAAVTSRAWRIIGYLEAVNTAGAWANPTVLQLFGPGINKPGEVVAHYRVDVTTPATTANTYTLSNTAPVPANGASAVALPSITPASAANLIRLRGQVVVGNNNGASTILYAYINNGTSTLSTATTYLASGSVPVSISTSYEAFLNSASAAIYTLYYSGSAGTSALNSITGSATFGGTASTYLEYEEIQGALPEPANDNGSMSLRMVG